MSAANRDTGRDSGRDSGAMAAYAPALALLRAEMEALAAVLPAMPLFTGGVMPHSVTAAGDGAGVGAGDGAEVEAQFDNMPV